jgi:hypothetical protein
MPTERPSKKVARKPAPRYGIAEWFGKDITCMTPEERQRFGTLAAKQDRDRSLAGAPECPFLSELIPGARCNKAGGVCSFRKYGPSGETVVGDQIVTMCPSRFLQTVGPDKSLFSWISEKMLDIPSATVVKETPFLRSTADAPLKFKAHKSQDGENKENEKKAGRIDWILVNPRSIDVGELEWCAVETQALYFSGKRMRLEFDAYASRPSPVLFPVGKRRPDYRSSGPKRLWPQLDVKVPVLRNWGKKVVVVVDRFFFQNMNTLIDPSPRARNDKERRENADVAWFIVDYDESLHLCSGDVVFTSLDSSRIALNATEPLSKADFTEKLRSVISDRTRQNKVFTASE